MLEKDDGIDLKAIMDEGAIVVFSLNSLQNRSATEMMGRLITKDVSAVISVRNAADNFRAYVVYDEHGSYISEDIEAQFAMGRSKGACIVTAVQEITDYNKF